MVFNAHRWLLLLGSAAVHGKSSESEAERVLDVRIEAIIAYEHWECVRKDVVRAIKLYCKAARAGDAEANFNLGWIYAGRAVTRDDGSVALFFERAAERGHERARKMLSFVTDVRADIPECLQEKHAPVIASQISAAPALRSDIEPDILEPLSDFVATTSTQKKAIELVNKLAGEYGVSPRLAFADSSRV